MSNREKVLQRLEAAMAGLEAAAEQRVSAAGRDAGQNDVMQGKLDAVSQERDRLAAKVEEQAKHNADLGARLDKAIAKLTKVLEKA